MSTKAKQQPKRTRVRSPRKLSLSDDLKRHSPIKRGVIIKNEDKPITKYDKIMSKLYLGNFQAAKDKEFFEKKKIKAVLNCTKDIPNHFQSHKNAKGDFDIEYMRIPVDDSLLEVDFKKMYDFVPVMVEFIHKHIDIQGNNCFVHCYAGRQRSVTGIAMYLIVKHNMTPNQACKYVLSKRPEAFHHGLSLNFEKTIERYYNNCVKKSK
jgi:protein tyrosine phosphatase